MTKRKDNPGTRGRKRVPQFAYRLLRARWKRYEHEACERGLSAPELADAFIAENQSWLRTHKINPGQYTSLKNDLSKGKRERDRTISARRAKWGFVTNIAGQRFFSANVHYIRYAQASALGIPLSGITMTIP
jgi:hypothetical protein